MAVVDAKANPKITDTVEINFDCTDEDGCALADPYKVDSVKIYFVARDYNYRSKTYENWTYDQTKLDAAISAEKDACDSPTDANILLATRLRQEAEDSRFLSTFTYSDAIPVEILGDDLNPAWIESDEENSLIEHVTEDEDGNVLYGKFRYEWSPVGRREGDYFVCWTWTSLPAGESSSAHFYFQLEGDTQATTSIPSHRTAEGKYETLIDLYWPKKLKVRYSRDDVTPAVIRKLGSSVAQGFTFLEDMGNQIVDLHDANATHESLLPLLSNMLGLKLKSDDPTLWRRQIKNAVSLYKKKGTLEGLREALAQSGIALGKLTQLWQVVSKYTWQESFLFEGYPEWTLEKVALELDDDNFELRLRRFGETSYDEIDIANVSFETVDGVTTLRWTGDLVSTGGVELEEGDRILVIYKVADVPNSTEQTLENYLRSLSLMDQRDETTQEYPPKNWNARALEADDPLFDLLVATRHPYVEPLIWGQIRTEFPFGENVYNMETYNGSLRDSTNPCHIDKEFLDHCDASISSSYSVELEIENLSDDRIAESQDVLREYLPFHARLHTLNITGTFNEFMAPPVEEIEMFVTVNGEEKLYSAGSKEFFHRSMRLASSGQDRAIYRDDLAEESLEYSGTGTAYNVEIVVYSPDVNFETIGASKSGSSVLENLSDDTITTISGMSGHTAIVNRNMTTTGGHAEVLGEPLDPAAFTFRVSHVVTDGTLCNVTQENRNVFNDENADFVELGVQPGWVVYLPDYSENFDIVEVLHDGSLLIDDPTGLLPNSNVTGLEWTLKNGSDEIEDGDAGKVTVTTRARVEVLSSGVQPIQNLVQIGDWQYLNRVPYRVSGFVDETEDQFFIDGYSYGDVGGTNLQVYRRLTDSAIGYYSYRGMKLRVSGIDLETTLEINNGHNPPNEEDVLEDDRFKENFILFIGDDRYAIEDIDGDSPSGSTTITLNGPFEDWSTFDVGGTSVNFDIYRYSRKSVTLYSRDDDERTFGSIDRRGRETIDGDVEDGSDEVISAASTGLNDHVSGGESISFFIEFEDGNSEEGQIL